LLGAELVIFPVSPATHQATRPTYQKVDISKIELYFENKKFMLVGHRKFFGFDPNPKNSPKGKKGKNAQKKLLNLTQPQK